MDRIDTRQVVWANVSALMQHHWQGENLNRLAREAEIGPASAVRLKKQQTSIGLEVIERVSAVFGLQPWQLMVPGMDPAHLPTLMPMSESERAFYERMLAAAKELKSP